MGFRTGVLNRREKAFARIYLVEGNAAEAAKKAGYSPKGAKQAGYRLLKRPHIIMELSRLSQKAAQVTNQLLAAGVQFHIRKCEQCPFRAQQDQIFALTGFRPD